MVRHTLNLIDRTHDDGNLNKISVITTTSPNAVGSYYSTDTEGQYIAVKPKSHHPRMTMAHEVGHFLDHRGFHVPTTGLTGDLKDFTPREDVGKFASEYHADFQEWRDAVRASQGFKDLTSPYHRKCHECWARSYAQWLARKDLQLTSELQKMRPDWVGVDQQWRGVWRDDDFAPIADAIEKLFKKKGWLP